MNLEKMKCSCCEGTIDLYSLIASNLSNLHWDNGCKNCPLIEECIKADNDKNKDCQDIWYEWLKSMVDER